MVAVNWDCRSLLVLESRTETAVFCAGAGVALGALELPPEQAVSNALIASAK
jgi:hypothetical protein